MAANPIPSPSNDAEVARLTRLTANYQSRIAELCIARERASMADEAANVVSRAQALAAGAEYQPVRSVEAISDEIAVLRGAVTRVCEQTIDARSVAVVRITRDEKLCERASQARAQVALKCHELLAAIDAAQALADEMESAELSAVGPRWPGCPAAGFCEAVATLALETSEGVIDAEAVRELQRKAGIFVEPVFSEAPNRPAPVIVKSLRRKVIETVGELMG